MTDETAFTPTAEVAEVAETIGRGKRRRSRSVPPATPGTLTAAQVSRVLDTLERVENASDATLAVVRSALKKEQAKSAELVKVILTTSRDDNPLAVLAELRRVFQESPFAAAAMIAGMGEGPRNRAFAVLQAVTGETRALSRKDVEAATLFAETLQRVSDASDQALADAAALIG